MTNEMLEMNKNGLLDKNQSYNFENYINEK